MWRVVLGTVICLLMLALPAWTQDLRDQYSTQSLEAAKLIQQTIQLVQAKKPRDAVKAIDAAIKADPQCQMAHYWRGNALSDAGDIEAAMEAFQTALSDKVRRRPRMSAATAYNLALTNARLKEYDEACIWFTRAIMEDSTNQFKDRGKAYRNLGITLKNQNRPLSAAIAVAFAYEDNAPNTPYEMVRTFFNGVGNQEVARILHFREAPPKVEKREKKSNLLPIPTDGNLTAAIDVLLTDPEGRFVIAWPKKVDHYYIIDTTTDKLTVQKVETGRSLDHPCLAQGYLYAVTVNPTSIEKIEVASGKAVEKYSIAGQTPSSLAVLPTQQRAYFGAERVVHELNLKTGKIQKTNTPGQVVVAHPNQQSVYSWLKPERTGGGAGHVIINGKPVFFRSNTTDWLQTILFKSQIVSSGLLIAEVRENVASNARQLSISPDGNWIAVAGGGGWRPNSKDNGFGYGVAVFATANFEHVQGFFKSEAYPHGVAFNPVTSQIVALRGQDAKVYHLSDPNEFFELRGKFTGPAAWSGNGKFLFLAREAKDGGGLFAYSNDLSAAEVKLASDWPSRIVVTPIELPVSAKIAPTSFNPVPGYDKFEIGKPTRDELARTLAKIIASKRDERPGPWNQYPAYQDDKVTQVIDEVREPLAKKEDVGIAIFKLKKAVKTNGKSVPLKFYLAEGLHLSNQSDDAESLLVEVVRADAGRTNLSCLALNRLAAILGGRDDSLPALHCLAQSLHLDRANPQTIAQAAPLLKKHNFKTEADRLAQFASGSTPVSLADLPKLAAPPPAKKVTSGELYQKAAWSVVLIKTSTGSGSGFCIARNDIIVTNNHVVAGVDSAEVYPFIIKDKVSVKLPAVQGHVVYRSATEDIAILKLDKAPDHLAPLAVAAASPNPGEKVYAIGSPGLGKQILEQSISEGLVSSKNRMLEGTVYLQHSAPVNPGNSGGPLLDENCHVVGIVTLNARLANVGFAIPTETLRRIFTSP